MLVDRWHTAFYRVAQNKRSIHVTLVEVTVESVTILLKV